ncbi:MAG: TonB-dependent receptor [Ignavibacteria bacterium]|jgi:iron complex outermembrane receptor protein
MKILIILFFFTSGLIFAQEKVFEGIIKDAETGSKLINANIQVIGEGTIGTTSDDEGKFSIKHVFEKGENLRISYVGYETYEIPVTSLFDPKDEQKQYYFTFEMKQKILSSQTVLVEATIGEKGITPITFDQIKGKEIEKNYTLYDIPKYLSDLPSTTFYSESGNAIGYNYVTIRGFDQRRISVLINGIPQNDPEDHNVYWLDFPDLLGSMELIQVQRGAGSGVFGYPAIGGSINMITSSFSNRPMIELSSLYGSYHTRKYSAAFSSGLINNRYSIYVKVGKILSSGYKELTNVDFSSYYVSAVRYDENFTTQINLFGGPFKDGLGYTGVAKFAVKDRELRRKNYSYWEADDNGYTYIMNRKPEEIENFSQPHYELFNEWQINDNLKFNSALFLVLGNGFFDFDGSWADTIYLRLTQANGFNPDSNPGNTIIKAKVENTQYGWLPRFSLNHEKGTLIFGGELRRHRSVHWGSISYADNLPEGVTDNYKYYSYRGGKDIASAFLHESFNLNDQVNLLGEIQLAYHNYKIFDEAYIGNDFSIDNLFINPRFGINYKPLNSLNVYFSFARVSREPRLKTYYDAAESSGGAVPQFEQSAQGVYDFNSPLVKPETMNDFEIGASLTGDNYSFSLNLFYMLFDDEIVKKGQVDRFGQPITGNVDRTIHKGIELSGLLQLWNNRIEIFGNATYGQNTIESGRSFIDEVNFIELSGNSISGFPEFMSTFGATLNYEGFYVRWTWKYVGKFYSDNFDDNLSSYLIRFPELADYNDNVNEAYFVSDIFASYEFEIESMATPWKIFFQINNIFDNLYSTNAIGKEFFPAAERNFLAGIEVGL